MGEKRKPATICIQSGWKPKNGEPRVLPIYQSTTFKYETSEQMGRLFDLEEDGYFYTRLANPTNDAVAEKICELEGGIAAMLTSSGQAANYYAAFNICNAGDHIISAATIYGETSNLFTVTMKNRDRRHWWIRMHRRRRSRRRSARTQRWYSARRLQTQR